jgi:acetyl esterase/lipase
VKKFCGGTVLVVLACCMGLGHAATPLAAGGKTVLLWPNGAPGAQGSEDIDKPSLTIFLPAGANATKTGVVVVPGGGYEHLAMGHEGVDIAHWLNTRGVAAFVLTYRLGPKYHYPIELEDAQRAIRIVRVNAAEFGVAEDHVGMWGFDGYGRDTF